MSVALLRYDDSVLPYVASVYMNKTDATWDRVYKIVGRSEDSCLEFGHAIFEIRSSLVVRDHLARYRMASMAAAGLRYNEPADFVVPPGLSDEAAKILGDAYRAAEAAYAEMRDEDAKKEVARYLIPCGVEVRYLMAFNLRSLAKDVFPQRLWSPGVQPETRRIVALMATQTFGQNPRLWDVVRRTYGNGVTEEVEADAAGV